jgi:hypothetical protein
MPDKQQKTTLPWWQHSDFGLLVYAVLRDSFVYLSLGIAGLFTIETLLPGFVTFRFNLALPILFEAILFIAITLIVSRYQLAIPVSSRFNRFVLLLAGLWLVAILFISLLRFALISKLIIIAFTLLILRLLWAEYLNPQQTGQ